MLVTHLFIDRQDSAQWAISITPSNQQRRARQNGLHHSTNMSKQATEMRLHVRIRNLIKAMKVQPILDRRENAQYYDVADTSEQVYARLVGYFHSEPYSSMAEDDFKESK